MTLHNIRTDLQVVPIDKLIWSCVRNYWGKDRTSKITIININATTILGWNLFLCIVGFIAERKQKIYFGYISLLNVLCHV